MAAEVKTNIWTTERVNAIIKKWNDTGVLEKDNPFWEKNVNWRKPGLNYSYTQTEMLEQGKIFSDILYYAETYASVLTDEGEKLVELRPYQSRALLQLKKFRNNIYLASRQIGKCLDGGETVEIYTKRTDSYNHIRLFDLFFSRKKNKNWNDKLQWTLFKWIEKAKEKGYKRSESLMYGMINLLIFFRYKLWKYSKEHEIISSIVPKEDVYIKGLQENYLTAVHLRNRYKMVKVRLSDRRSLTGAEDHLVYLTNGRTKKLKDLTTEDSVLTKTGFAFVLSVEKLKKERYCFDVTVNSGEASFFSSGILSHNSIISGIFITWYLLTNTDRNVVLTSQTEDKVKDLLEKIETVLKNLPFFLKLGIVFKNVLSMKYDNRIRLIACTTTENTAAGITAHLFYCDEFALIHKNFLNKFFRTIYPTMSSSKISKMIITSTPRGKNKFWQLYTDAMNGKNTFNPMRTDWFEVPIGKDKDGNYIYRGEEWKNEMIADLGSEEDFNQEFGNQFVAGSDLLFQSPLLMKMKQFEVDFVHRIIPILEEKLIDYAGLLRWHPKFDMENLMAENSKFVISVDLAEGTGGDYQIIDIFQIVPMSRKEIESMKIFNEEKDFFKLVQVGKFRDNLTEIPELSKIFYHLVTDIIAHESVKAVLETNYDGKFFMDKVDSIYGEENEIEPDHLWVLFPYNMVWENAKTFKKGIKQGEESKRIGCKIIKDKIKYNQIVVMERNSVEETSSMARNKRGSFEGQMRNDDSAMTVINISHYFQTPDFREQVDELMETAPKEFVELVYKKLKRELNESDDDDFFIDDDEDEKMKIKPNGKGNPRNPFS